MRGRFAPYIIGLGLIALALLMVLFSVWALFERSSAAGFITAALAAVLVGAMLVGVGSSRAEPTRREALLAVLLLWLLVPLFGAIPYAVSGGLSPLNAMFESMSGFTTTGATVLRDFEAFSSSLFMWRSLTQWIGGVGIIVLFIAVFPQLAIAGRQLFFTEAPGPTEDRLTPRLRNTANAVLIVYVGLTVLCALAYWLAGMSFYGAVAHAFTTLAAGGFSPEPLSFLAFTPTLTWISVLFMVFAGANFALQYRVLMSRRPLDLFRDAEFRAYIIISLIATTLLVFALRGEYAFVDALRHGAFQVMSILTTTGYASADFAAWPRQAEAVLLVLMFVGGSAGSAAGGVKVVRWLIIGRNTEREVRRALHPRAIAPVRVGNRVISEDVLRAVSAFIFLYIGLFAITAVVLVWFEADFTTAFTASIACIGNIGPGLAAVGPLANFADLHPVSRAVLIFGMYAGRLEVVTVFVLVNRDFWILPRRGPLSRGG